MFYFEHLLNTALGAIDGTRVIPTITNMAFAILLIGFLIGLYQATLRGGDLQALAVTAIKYLVVAMILSNWTTVFRDVNGSFTAVADFVSNSSGAGDMFMNWMTQLQQQATTNPNLTFWDMITGDISGTITVGLLLIAYIVYALAIIIFCFFYTLYGTVLYVTGPLVLALIPVSGIGQLGKTYAINLMIWNAWGILYSVFGALITAIHFNQVNNVLGNGFLGFLQGVPDSTMLGLVSIFYALAVAMVPFIAKGIISGDVGSTVTALVRAAATAAGAALAAVSGFAAGAGAAAAPAAAGAGAGGGSSSMAISSSMPPPTPATSMAGFLQSGLASAMNSNSSPVAPAVSGGTNGSSGNENGAHSASASPARSGYIYSPKSVTQAVTFNVARALGRAAGRQKPEDN
ncbi:MAG TPA: hypothetical protein VJ453_03820 [Terriglobales bacterium]|nr:hypothetical protein [Terriglobales bacterium]